MYYLVGHKKANLSPPRGQLRVCDINNRDIPARDALNAQSGCEKGGTAFLCDDYQPFAVGNNTAYGFAVVFSSADCCRCFEVTWPTARSARGKTMIVQAINVGDISGDLTAKDIVILTTGGGVGPNDAGCRYQDGKSWWVWPPYRPDLPNPFLLAMGWAQEPGEMAVRLTQRVIATGGTSTAVCGMAACAQLCQTTSRAGATGGSTGSAATSTGGTSTISR